MIPGLTPGQDRSRRGSVLKHPSGAVIRTGSLPNEPWYTEAILAPTIMSPGHKARPTAAGELSGGKYRPEPTDAAHGPSRRLLLLPARHHTLLVRRRLG